MSKKSGPHEPPNSHSGVASSTDTFSEIKFCFVPEDPLKLTEQQFHDAENHSSTEYPEIATAQRRAKTAPPYRLELDFVNEGNLKEEIRALRARLHLWWHRLRHGYGHVKAKVAPKRKKSPRRLAQEIIDLLVRNDASLKDARDAVRMAELETMNQLNVHECRYRLVRAKVGK